MVILTKDEDTRGQEAAISGKIHSMPFCLFAPINSVADGLHGLALVANHISVSLCVSFTGQTWTQLLSKAFCHHGDAGMHSAWSSHSIVLCSFHVSVAHSPLFQVSHPDSNLITALPSCSLCRFRCSSSALLSSPRSAVLHSLTFSWDPGLLMTFLQFVSLSELAAVDYLKSVFGVRDSWHAHACTHTCRLWANTLWCHTQEWY